MPASDITEICAAGVEMGMSSSFADSATSFGAGGTWASNIERDLLRYARRDLGAPFELYTVRCIARSSLKATKYFDIGVLLPHELAHWLFEVNQSVFYELWVPSRVVNFWKHVIARDEPWFRAHPLYVEIRGARESELHRYLPLHLFGDDTTMGKGG